MSKYLNVIFAKVSLFLTSLWTQGGFSEDTIHSVSCSVSFNMDWMFIQCLLHANKNELLLRLNLKSGSAHDPSRQPLNSHKTVFIV